MIDLAGSSLKIRAMYGTRIYFQGRIISGHWERFEPILTDYEWAQMRHELHVSVAVLSTELPELRRLSTEGTPKLLKIWQQDLNLLNRLAYLVFCSIDQPLHDGSLAFDMNWRFMVHDPSRVTPKSTLEKVDWKRVGF